MFNIHQRTPPVHTLSDEKLKAELVWLEAQSDRVHPTVTLNYRAWKNRLREIREEVARRAI